MNVQLDLDQMNDLTSQDFPSFWL
uniref:Uncharacterized protein n=1 Tax=Anguilla anguilla TaxID=7936 RepID=A0A0E9PCS4_ANGAN